MFPGLPSPEPSDLCAIIQSVAQEGDGVETRRGSGFEAGPSRIGFGSCLASYGASPGPAVDSKVLDPPDPVPEMGLRPPLSSPAPARTGFLWTKVRCRSQSPSPSLSPFRWLPRVSSEACIRL